MSAYKCIYFETDSGRAPAEEFVDFLHQRTQQKYFELVRLLQIYGKSLPKPHSDFLGGDEIYELENRIIFTNGFIKKQQKAPKLEVQLAKERRKLYIGKHKG